MGLTLSLLSCRPFCPWSGWLLRASLTTSTPHWVMSGLTAFCSGRSFPLVWAWHCCLFGLFWNTTGRKMCSFKPQHVYSVKITWCEASTLQLPHTTRRALLCLRLGPCRWKWGLCWGLHLTPDLCPSSPLGYARVTSSHWKWSQWHLHPSCFFILGFGSHGYTLGEWALRHLVVIDD